MTASKIEWTERSDWNPIRGCTRVSEGCRHCYAEQIAGRFSDPGQAFHGFAQRTSAGGRWTGKVELVEDRLTLPLRWRKPSLIFASSTSDIFHESLSDGDIDRIFAVMALAPHHRFQVLTKRAERMRAWFDRYDGAHDDNCADMVSKALEPRLSTLLATRDAHNRLAHWPLPNVWPGVSVEDQAAADERIPHLLATPAAVRFLSCEPLLGPVDCAPFLNKNIPDAGESGCGEIRPLRVASIDWVIAGGESGRGARPMHPDWARNLRDQCADAGVPFFFKQWGEFAPGEIAGEFLNPDRAAKGFEYFDGRWDECWSEPEGHCDDEPDVYRIGKSRAGRLLDGVEHSGMPA